MGWKEPSVLLLAAILSHLQLDSKRLSYLSRVTQPIGARARGVHLLCQNQANTHGICSQKS